MGLFRKKEGPAVSAAAEVAVDANVLSDADLIAVITAAVAAYESENSASTNLIIRKIDRTAGVIPAWGVAGNREQIDTRRM